MKSGGSASHTVQPYESLALAAFGSMLRATEEPLLKKLLRYVMSDEARHVAFGVLSLKEYYGELTDVELRYRQRYVDLWANPQVMQLLKLRGRIVAAGEEAMKHDAAREDVAAPSCRGARS